AGPRPGAAGRPGRRPAGHQPPGESGRTRTELPARDPDGGGEMTAQTMPAQPAEDTTLRPLPWRRMAGVIWRQHRFALVTVAALLSALAVYLWIVGSS